MKDTQFGPKGWTPDRLGSQAGKTFLITGANAGAGFQAARILLSKGGKVVMLNRSTERSAAAVTALKRQFGAQAEVGFIRMDLAELASVRAAAAEVLRTVPRIDALICNAAIAQAHGAGSWRRGARRGRAEPSAALAQGLTPGTRSRRLGPVMRLSDADGRSE